MTPFVPLRPVITDFEVTVPLPGLLAGRIVFDRPMNTAALPALGTFTLTSDGVPVDMLPVNWQSPTQLDCNTTGDPPVVTGFVRQNVLDTNCYSALGTYARRQANVQFFP